MTRCLSQRVMLRLRHSIRSKRIQGRRQAVRHRPLTPTFAGSNPAVPAIFFRWIRKAALTNDPVDRLNRRGFSAEKRIQPSPPKFDPVAQSAEHLPFKQGVRGSNPRWVTNREKPASCGFFHFSQTRRGLESISNDIFNSSAILKNQRKIKACNTKCNTKIAPPAHSRRGSFCPFLLINGRCHFLRQIIAVSVLE